MKRAIPYPKNALVSYHYFADYDLDRLPNLRLIGDSGAFSAKSQGVQISVDELAEWGLKWRHRLAWVAALDVIGDQEATFRNWRRMVDKHGLNAVPTIHYGCPPTELDRYAERGCDFVGLGGLVGTHANKQMRWLVQIFKYARDKHPGMRFHGWGCTSEPHFKLPFYSVDSSSWTSAVRYGQMLLNDPRNGGKVTYRLDGREAYKPSVAKLLADYYGVSPKDGSYSSAANKGTIVKLASLSMSVKEQRFRALHGSVSAPEWIWGEDAGPHYHLATAQISNADPALLEKQLSNRDNMDKAGNQK